MQILQAGALALVLGFAVPDGADAKDRLSKAQLLRLFPGTYSGVAKDGTKVRIQGHSDGSIRGIASEKHDQGRWSIEGDRLCVKWSFWLSGKKRCGYVIRDGIWYVAVKANGKARMRFRR